MVEQINKILQDKVRGKIEIKEQDNIIHGCITQSNIPYNFAIKKAFSADYMSEVIISEYRLFICQLFFK